MNNNYTDDLYILDIHTMVYKNHQALLFACSLGGVNNNYADDLYILDIHTMVCKNHQALLFVGIVLI